MPSYVHKDIGMEIKTISGYFTYIEECRLGFRGREILCVRGVGVVDNSCCGVGGCSFIEVPGYIVSWKNAVDLVGHFISTIDLIESDEEKNGIKTTLNNHYPHSHVSFG